MWLLESAKDRILAVDTPGQQVLPCVRYGTTCWLLRKDLLTCLIKCAGLVWLYLWDHKLQEGLRAFCCTQYGETLAIVKGAWGYSVVPNMGKPMVEQDIWYGVKLCKGMEWSPSLTPKEVWLCSAGMTTWRFSSHWKVMKSPRVDTGY
jgi:hypothetical protein